MLEKKLSDKIKQGGSKFSILLPFFSILIPLKCFGEVSAHHLFLQILIYIGFPEPISSIITFVLLLTLLLIVEFFFQKKQFLKP